MESSRVSNLILALPEVSAWPALRELIEGAAQSPPDVKWDLPLRSCAALQQDPETALFAAAALLCLHTSLVVTDDLLDHDPRGIHHRVGTGPAANLAIACQAVAGRILDRAPVAPERKAVAQSSLCHMMLQSALGQSWDADNLQGEANYWRIVRTKSAPFFGEGLFLGALLGGATMTTCEQLRSFGQLTGEVVQIYDDLLDALEAPASPDWIQQRNNLAILYALTANHSERDHFEKLVPLVRERQTLAEAQQILVSSGALSYCLYHVINRYQEAKTILAECAVIHPKPLLDLLSRQIQPIRELLSDLAIPMPQELDGSL